MSPKPTPETVEQPGPERDPTLREVRATLGLVWSEIDNRGGSHEKELFRRIYSHMAWLVDAFFFDVDTWADDGGRS